MRYFRNKLFKLGYMQENQLIKLVYSKHAEDRLYERSAGSLFILPERIQILRKNVTQGWIENGKLKKFEFRIPYNSREFLFLIVVDGYFVKTLWWDKIKSDRNGNKMDIPTNSYNSINSYSDINA
jgi:hypothetical protein